MTVRLYYENFKPISVVVTAEKLYLSLILPKHIIRVKFAVEFNKYFYICYDRG